ncbi:MAG: DHHW family protein [Hespellia sp.]|nr:DHHW family protein [Hespellia sp.]
MKKRQKKVKRKLKLQAYIAGSFLACLLIAAIVNLVVPARTYSKSEDRNLMQRPQFSVSAFINGDFARQYEDYLKDQFVGRDGLRMIRTEINLFAGGRKSDGIFKGKNGQLMEDAVIPDSVSLEQNITAIQNFTAEFPDVTASMILVPDAVSVWSDQLPPLATVANQSAYLKNVKRNLEEHLTWIDVESVMNEHKNEKIYYKTDAHWTTLAAYYAFQQSGDALKIETGGEAAFSPYPVTTTFNGKLSSKSGYETGTREEIDIYVPKDKIQLVVNQVEEQNKTTSLYDSSQLDSKNQYEVFLGGNYGLLDIKTTANSDRRLLIFKDSFANCYIPFLTPHFREIVVVDPKYYTGTGAELMSTYQISDMMFLYSANGFMSDNNMSGVLTGE